MVRYCDQCGAELKQEAIFCSKCGAKSDLPPEKNIENKSVEKQVNNTGNENVKNGPVEEQVNNTGNENVKNGSVEEQVNNTVNENTEQINDNVNETVNNINNNRVNNTNKVNDSFDFNNIDWNIVIKYSIVCTILSLLLGVIFFSLFYGNAMALYGFIIGLIISVLLFTPHIKDKTNAVVVGLAVGLLTSLLQSTVLSMFYGPIISSLLSMYAGNYILGLIFIGPICGYIGGVYLKDKINFPIINQYLGE